MADYDYTPLEPINYDQSKVPAEIKEYTDYTRSKALGVDVRESIARAGEIAGLIAGDTARRFDEQIVGTTNAQEVIDARLTASGVSHTTLRARLNAQDTDISDLYATKADQNFVDSQFSAIVSGAPKGTYTTLAELQSAYPSGTEGVFLVLENGHWYYWTTSWIDGGVYQSQGIGDNAVKARNVDGSSEYSENILDLTTLVAGEYYYATSGNPAIKTTSANWLGNAVPIPVKAGDVVRFNKAYINGYYVGVDDSGVVRQTATSVNPVNSATVTVATGVTGFYTAVYNSYVNTAMITINAEMPSTYESYNPPITKTLDWLEYVPQSITTSALSDDVINFILTNSGATPETGTSDWAGKTFITLGDSITWQDGKAYAQGDVGAIARGYQTHLKERLGFASYNNLGVSGKSVADGTANGAGTVTTGLGVSDYSIYDLTIIAGGTNDFKLNVPIGTIGTLGGTFDRNTFYGALQTLIEYILTNDPANRIVLFTPLHRDNGGYNSWDFANTAGHKLVDYRNAILEIGKLYGLPVCDLYANSGLNKFTLSTYTMDGLHPHDIGYIRIANYAVPFIENVGV